MGLVALGLVWLRRGYAASWRDEVVVLAPAALVLILVSAKTGFTIHLRYVLPVFPFVYVSISKVARAGSLGDRGVARLATVCLLWSVASSLWIYPHSLSYFNEVCGGPNRGHAYLIDSNLDWGQDLLYLKRWMDAHPEARPLDLRTMRAIEPSLLGLPVRLPGEDGVPESPAFDGKAGMPEPGWYAVGAHALRSRQGWGRRFLPLCPVAQAGYSIFIYHVEPDTVGWCPGSGRPARTSDGGKGKGGPAVRHVAQPDHPPKPG
jgi:hypothetical protein